VVVTVLQKRLQSDAPVRRGSRQRVDWIILLYALGLTAFLIAVMVQAMSAFSEYPVELLLCFFNGGLAIWGQLLSVRREASIHFISFFFCFLFMSAAPIVQLGAHNASIFRVDYLALWAAANGLAFTSVGIFFTYRLRPATGDRATTTRAASP